MLQRFTQPGSLIASAMTDCVSRRHYCSIGIRPTYKYIATNPLVQGLNGLNGRADKRFGIKKIATRLSPKSHGSSSETCANLELCEAPCRIAPYTAAKYCYSK